MAGNSSRRGAVRKSAPKKSAKAKTPGTGGKNRAGLAGRGPTPKAVDRPYHPAAKRAAAAKKAAAKKSAGKTPTSGKPGSTAGSRGPAKGRAAAGAGTRAAGTRTPRTARATATRGPKVPTGDWVIGRNATLEALQAEVPTDAVYVMVGIDMDDRVRETIDICRRRRLPLMEASRSDLDRMTNKAAHQGIAMKVPAFKYADAATFTSATLPLIVVLDGITDPRNLGAIVRSAAAFGATGVAVGQRRAVGMTASAWKTSAGAAARIPVAQVTNIARTLQDFKKAGCFVIGMDASGDQSIAGAVEQLGDGPVVIVIGAEGEGISRLVRETCDVVAQIPMSGEVESLNASVAASVALYEVSRRRS